MTKEKKRVIAYQVLIVIVGICVSIYYYWCLSNVEVPFHSDDAGSTFEIMNRNYFIGKGGSNSFDIFGIFTSFSVALFDINEFSTLLPFYLGFFFRFYITCNILISAKQDNRKEFFLKLLFLVYSCALLGVNGNAEITSSKFHIGPSLIILLIILINQKINNIWAKRILTVGLMILSMVQTDRVLSAIICVIPVILVFAFKACIGIIIKGDLDKKKQFLYGTLIIFACLVCGMVNVYTQISGRTFTSSGIYGSRLFSSLQEIINNLSTFFDGLFGMFNCQIIYEPIISVLFVPRFIKCVLLCITMGYIVVYIGKCIKQEHYDDNRLLQCMVTVIALLAFIMTGSQHGQISIRYCNIMLFILPVIAWKLLSSLKMWTQFQYKYKVLLLLVLCICELNVVNYTDVYKYDNVAEKLQENGIEVAIAPYWSSTVVTVISEGAVQLQPCTLYGGKLETFMNNLALYRDKSTKFNAVITSNFKNGFYDDGGSNLTDESIPQFFGTPSQIVEMDENYKIHIYDYDLRTFPQKFEKQEDNKYCLQGIFFGEYRIDITDSFAGELVFPDSVEIIACSETKEGKTYQFRILDKMNQLVVETKEISGFTMENNMVLKCIWEAYAVKMADGSRCSKETPYFLESGTTKSEPVDLKAGNYKLVLYGEDLSAVSVSADCSLDEGDHGTKRLVYYLYLNEDSTVNFNILSQEKVSITNISLEACADE